jgi:predicted MFS family arabinose efflux permease
MGAQNSLLKAIITDLMPVTRRSTGFGLFYTCYGIAWFIGSAAMGILYDISILGLVVFSIALQLLALPVFFLAKSNSKNTAFT